MNDDILRIRIPAAAKICGFDDDSDFVAVAKNISQLKETTNRTVEQEQNWLNSLNSGGSDKQ